MSIFFRHLVVDGFLEDNLHQDLLEYAIGNQDVFLPSIATHAKHTDDSRVMLDRRVSWYCQEGLGAFRKKFTAAVLSNWDEWRRSIGVEPFKLDRIEIELVAHRDGSFFKPHVDTYYNEARKQNSSDRILSLVYYLHALPRHFSGGEIALYPIGGGEPVLVDPADNRLLIFPSFTLHEVRAVHCEPNEFEFARFSVNCWLHRASTVSADTVAENQQRH